MENLAPKEDKEQGENDKNTGPLIIFIITLILAIIAFWQFSGGKTEKRPMDANELLKQQPVTSVPAQQEPKKEQPALSKLPATDNHNDNVPVNTQEVIIEKQVDIDLPTLDDSDLWLEDKLPELTWRNELLSLVITDDIIRRFVVFTDNFSQGLLAYEHSVFVQPQVKFAVDEQSQNADLEGEQKVFKWDKETSKRFDVYVDLLRSVDSTTLVQWYVDMKPLIDEAYQELGYQDDFTYTLQQAIDRVLDMEVPKSAMDINRTSVMYKFQDPELEALDDSDKLLLRIGKENLLIIKSVLLEINEKLAKTTKGK